MARSRAMALAVCLAAAIACAPLVGPAAARAAEVDEEAARAVRAAQALRSKGQPVVAAPDGNLYCEAEEFQVVSPGWQALPWGQNYYAATFANTFLSRKAFLGAPAGRLETPAAATIRVEVPQAGRYLALVRYEAAYRFQTQFHLRVEQGGRIRLDRLYGARDNVKIWAFGEKLKTEVAWSWGAVENIVWEGHDAFVDLDAGPAAITLVAAAQPPPAAKRNVDLVLLTRDEAGVKHRIEKEAYLPLDGLLTQAGDVWLRARNAGTTPVTVKSLAFPGGPMQQHSPYWVHLRTWKGVQFEAPPGQTTEWIDVGGTMDTLNDGQWGFQTSGPCQLEFGLKNAAGQMQSLRVFDASGALPLVARADTRYGAPLQTPDEATRELFDYVRQLKTPDTRLRRMYVHATGALPREFYDFYGLNGARLAGPRGYADWRGLGAAQLEERCQKLSPAEREAILVMSLGDEISLPTPSAQAAETGFPLFLQSQGVTLKELDPEAGPEGAKTLYNVSEAVRQANPLRYYWSKRFQHHHGIQEMKKLTDALRKHLPNARVGANFSPHHGGGEHTFLGESFKWAECFRQQGLTMPWAEDYIWQVPVGSPQMNGINLDLFRAGLRGRPRPEIMYYVMPHMPGNTPAMWRRLWHNALGHGATMLNLFEFDPVWVAYTENHVTGRAMYAEVLRAMRELGAYEDIVQDGRLRPARAALWFSETGDIWRDNLPPFGAAKRGLYVAILQQQTPLDFVLEPDALAGALDGYHALYLADRHVSRAASAKIAAWVERGGVLFATAGAGMFDEANQPNAVLRALLGVAPGELVAPPESRVEFIKQDLNFVPKLDTVTFIRELTPEGLDPPMRLSVFGAVGKFRPAGDAKPLAAFDDGSPAVVERAVGRGRAVYCGFLPALSWFKPATPVRPLDRGAADDAMAHHLPTDFDPAAHFLIGWPTRDIKRPATSDYPGVEVSILEAPAATALVVTNWTNKPIAEFQLTLRVATPGKNATLASGKPVTRTKSPEGEVFLFDLDVAEVVILR